MKGQHSKGLLFRKQQQHISERLAILSVLAFFFLSFFCLYYYPSSSSSPSLHLFGYNSIPPSTLHEQSPPPLLSSSYFDTNTTTSSTSSSSPPPPLKPWPAAPTCDVSKGEWVRDTYGPYYTNTTCWTIQEHQNCMKYGRPDTDFLKWRWKPDGCELPLFDPAEFLELVRGKSMAFVGDSLARNQMQSLMCLLSRVDYPKDVSDTSEEHFKRMLYTSHNFTISSFWSPFLVKAEEGHLEGLSWSGLFNIYLDKVDDRWFSSIGKFDYLIISGGNWFTRPSVFFEDGKLVGSNYFLKENITTLTMYYGHNKAFQTAFSAITDSKDFKGTTILRTVSPDHFENGEWNTGGDCVRTSPFRRNDTRLGYMDLMLYNAQVKESLKAKMEGKKRGLEFRLLDTTQAMLLRPDGHPSRYGHRPQANVTLRNDCVHWCLPGPVDMWNDLLLHVLKF